MRFEYSGCVTDGFKKKILDRGLGGWVELYPNVVGIFNIFVTGP